MKSFLTYTALRIGLFALCWAVLYAVAAAVWGATATVWLWSLVGGGVISAILSLKLLAGPRERFARSVEERASRAAAKVEEMRSKEDFD